MKSLPSAKVFELPRKEERLLQTSGRQPVHESLSKPVVKKIETWMRLNSLSKKHPFCIWYRQSKYDPL